MPEPKARTRNLYLTTEAFREIAEAALEELCDNTATLEMATLISWQRELKRYIGRVSDHQTSDGSTMPIGRVDPDDASGVMIGRGFEDL